MGRRRSERNPFSEARSLPDYLLPSTQRHYLADTKRGRIWMALWMECMEDEAYKALHGPLLNRSFRYVQEFADVRSAYGLDLTACFEISFWLTRADVSFDWIQAALRDALFYGERTAYLIGTPHDLHLEATIKAGRKLALYDNNLTRSNWDEPPTNPPLL